MPTTARGLRARRSTIIKRLEDAQFIGWRLMEESFAADLRETEAAMQALGVPIAIRRPPKPMGSAAAGEPIEDIWARRKPRAYTPNPQAVSGRVLQVLSPHRAMTCREAGEAIGADPGYVNDAMRVLCRHRLARRVPLSGKGRTAQAAYLKEAA